LGACALGLAASGAFFFFVREPHVDAAPVESGDEPPIPSEVPASLRKLYPQLKLGAARNGRELTQDSRVLNVLITGRDLFLEGERIESSFAIIDANAIASLHVLAERLTAAKRQWLRDHPNELFDGRIRYWVDSRIPILVLKSVFRTAARSGYPTIDVVAKDHTTSKLVLIELGTHIAPPEKQDVVQFDGDGRILALSKEPKVVTGGISVVNGSLQPELVERMVRQNFGRIRRCYAEGLARNPKLQGALEVRFVVGRDGAVTNAGNGGTTLSDAAVVSCVLSTFRDLTFRSPDGGIASIKYPLIFTAG
jgi:hypothetical protein